MERERETTRDLNARAHDSGERPTIPAWAAAAIRELEKQLDRLYSGRACRTCRASGEELRGGPAGVYVRVCPDCDGVGIDSADRP